METFLQSLCPSSQLRLVVHNEGSRTVWLSCTWIVMLPRGDTGDSLRGF